MHILFLGDSITEGFNTAELLPQFSIKNHGIWGTSTEELTDKIAPDWFNVPFDKAFICIGTNDLTRNHSIPYILDKLSLLINKVTELNKSAIQIYLISLFPTRNLDIKPNSGIDLYNSALHAYAPTNNFRYIHLNPFFKDAEGKLRTEFTNDGLHLTDAAYKHWANLFVQLV